MFKKSRAALAEREASLVAYVDRQHGVMREHLEIQRNELRKLRSEAGEVKKEIAKMQEGVNRILSFERRLTNLDNQIFAMSLKDRK